MIIIISEFLPDLWMGRQAPAWLLVASQLWCQGRWWWTEWEKQKRLQLLRQWSLDTIVTLLSPSLLANYYPLLFHLSNDHVSLRVGVYSSEKQTICIGLSKKCERRIESNTHWQSIWKNMNLPSFLHLMSYFNLIMTQHWGPLINTQKDFLVEYTATIVPWLYWSPGHFASSPPPTLCCSGMLLFALIVNCISIVSWYPQLSPSSCQLGAADRNHL